jgi:hypothetical protein
VAQRGQLLILLGLALMLFAHGGRHSSWPEMAVGLLLAGAAFVLWWHQRIPNA